ncbi:CBO0543 family protein [Lentibacillus juripiscarius]|uniref:CBO0543 family protein n=1 Tax=Lentibacillus juripiscarius TaxID=257446 RepID=A0ABW5V7W5_9BACI
MGSSLVPLTFLFIFIDRSKMLHLGFFGINYHLWFQYVNSAGVSMGLWEYPYELTSFQPSFTLDGSIAPVAFMLVYQWTLNHGKNVFLYSLLLSALFGFVMKPMMAYFDFFHMFSGVHYFYLFLFYEAFFVVSYLITKLFLWMQRKYGRKN